MIEEIGGLDTMLSKRENDQQEYLFSNVTISPFYAPVAHYCWSSLIGGISIKSKYTQHFQYRDYEPASLETHILKPCKFIKERCIYGGYLFSGYGHFIRESLGYLYFIKKFNLKEPIVFSYTTVQNLCEYQKDIFKLLGINNDILFIKDITNFSQLYVPPLGSLLYQTMIPEQSEAMKVYDSNPQKGKLLYISRKNFKGRTAKNEDKIEIMLKKKGWDIIYPEKMSIFKQLENLSTAEKIMGVCGSAFYSLLFLKRSSQDVFLLPRNYNYDYDIISHISGRAFHLLNITKENISGKGSTADKAFSLNEEELESILDSTNNFSDLEAAKDVMVNARIPLIKYKEFPRIFFLKKERPLPANSLFWLINYALDTGKRVYGAKKALIILLRLNQMQTFMIIKCYNFIINYFPDMLLIFYLYLKRLKINDNHPPLARFKANIVKKIPFSKLDSLSIFNDTLNITSHSQVYVESHLSYLGWIGYSPLSWISGDPTGKNRIEAIRCTTLIKGDTLQYGVKIKGGDWMYGKNGEIAGTTGKSTPIEGLIINYNGMDENNELKYRVRFNCGNWSDWYNNSSFIEFPQATISAIQLKIVRINKKSF